MIVVYGKGTNYWHCIIGMANVWHRFPGIAQEHGEPVLDGELDEPNEDLEENQQVQQSLEGRLQSATHIILRKTKISDQSIIAGNCDILILARLINHI